MDSNLMNYKDIYDNTEISAGADKKIKFALENLPSRKRSNKFKIAAAVIAFLCICSLASLFSLSAKNNSSTPPLSIGWNSSIYGPSGGEISESEIGKLLGEIKRIKEPMPIEEGDSNNIYIPVGSKVFEIKGIDINEAIAVEKDGRDYKYVKKSSMQ